MGSTIQFTGGLDSPPTRSAPLQLEALSSLRSQAGEHLIGIVVRRAVSLGKNLPAPSLEREPTFESALLDLAETYAPLRRSTDVVVLGRAHPPAPDATYSDISVTMGAAAARARVFGPRRVERGKHGLRFSQPEPLGPIDLSWANTYGGYDPEESSSAWERWGARAIVEPGQPEFSKRWDAHFEEPIESDNPAPYLLNPFGSGYLARGPKERLVDLTLPALEDAQSPLSLDDLEPSLSWRSRPRPVSFAPVHPYWSSYLLGWVGAAPSVDGADPYSFAPPGLTADFGETAQFELVGMHPEAPTLRGSLHLGAPTVTLRAPNARDRQLETSLKTVVFEPELDRAVLTFTAVQRALTPYSARDLAELNVTVHHPA
ncbi:MAG: DUF2169 domain-containing protein [Polyangiaceae bacterium]